MRKLIISVFSLLFVMSISAQDRIKVMSYNLLNYGNTTSYCTQTNNSVFAKNGYNATIVDYVKPDILGVVEMGSADFVHQMFLDSALNINGVSHYAKAKKMNTTGSSIISYLYYNQDKFGIAGVISLQSQVRDIVLYRLYYKSPNLAATQDTAFINCIVAHLKSSNTSADRVIRTQMVNQALGFLSNNYPADNYLFMGDLNIYSSSEGAYQALLNYSNSSYRFLDPINTPGAWNNNSSYAAVHTQSTHSSSNGCAAGGGLDDRFDFILMSDALNTGSKHISYVTGSYKAIGNDGNHFNTSINNGANNSVPANVLSALYNNSDHLPVVLELDLDNTIANISANELANQIRVQYENPINNQLKLFIKSEESKNVLIEIYDIQGRKIISQSNMLNKDSRINIEMANFAKGLYLIQIIDTDKQVIFKGKLIKH